MLILKKKNNRKMEYKMMMKKKTYNQNSTKTYKNNNLYKMINILHKIINKMINVNN